jgi:hypothetical protein
MPIGSTGPISFSAVYTEVFGGVPIPGTYVRMAKSNPSSTPSLVANSSIGATFGPVGSTGPYSFSRFHSYAGVTGSSVSIFLNNSSLDITVNAMRVNGIAISGASFPLTPGNNTTGYTTQFGTYTVEIDRSNSVSGQHIGISDSNSTPSCQNANAGNSTLSFSDIVISNAGSVTVNASDGLCS